MIIIIIFGDSISLIGDVRGTEFNTDFETLKDTDSLCKIIRYPEPQVSVSMVAIDTIL